MARGNLSPEPRSQRTVRDGFEGKGKGKRCA